MMNIKHNVLKSRAPVVHPVIKNKIPQLAGWIYPSMKKDVPFRKGGFI